ncbi:MAG: proline--tRNA ligase, partial [Bacilli bacterium]|nr:proline--tRNA ligase [Bacilli bacterium]
PKIYNQWCSVVRWEKTTRPFLRGSELLWQEGHCLFETEQEAEKNALDVLDIYMDMGKELLAIPFLTGIKTEKEKFAGAKATYTIEALMHDGKALQSGTTHYFGQGFAENFGIRYLGRDNALGVPHQTSWGVSTRLIGAVIMVHGDDNGLVLPPFVAPVQVEIVPIRGENENVQAACKKVLGELEALGIRAEADFSDHTPGWKFAEAEMKGIPLRIEIGPRDLENGKCVLAKRVSGEKITEDLEGLASKIPAILKEIHETMYQKACERLEANTKVVSNMEELKAMLDKGGYAKTMWCGDRECEDKVKEETQGGTSRCMPFDQTPVGDRCVCCGKPAKKVIYFAKAY